MEGQWLVVLTWTVIVGAIWFFFGKRSAKYKLPPGPPMFPIIGNIHHLMDSKKPPYHAAAELSETYGPLMLLRIGAKNVVFISSPELAMEVLKTEDHIYGNRPLTENIGVKRYLLYGDHHVGTGQLGDYHKFARKLIITEVLSPKKLQTPQAVAMRLEEQNLIIREAFEACTSAPKQTIKIRNLLTTLTVNVVTRIAFSRKFFGLGVVDEEAKAYAAWKPVIPELVALSSTMLAEDAFPALKWIDSLTGSRQRLKNCFSLMDSLLQKLLDEHKQHLASLSPQELKEYEPKDFMDVVLMLSKAERANIVMTDDRIKGVAADLILAGSETTSTTMEWTLSELLKNPDVLKKAQEEVDSVVGKDRCVRDSDTPQFRYLAATVKESLRMHTPVPLLLPRSTRAATKLGGYDIPAESFINVNVYAIAHNPSLWKNPYKFDPTRYLEGGEQADIDVKGLHPLLMPFGSGRRTCAGIAMAMTVVIGTLARLLHSFDWSLPEGTELDMSEYFGGVVSKKTPLEAIATPRLPLHLYNV